MEAEAVGRVLLQMVILRCPNRTMALFLSCLLLTVFVMYYYQEDITIPYVVKEIFTDHKIRKSGNILNADEDVKTNLHKFVLGSDNVTSYQPHAAKKYYIVIDWNGYNWLNKGDFVVDDTCLITRNKKQLNVSSAIVVTIRIQSKIEELPQVRFPWQRWVWLNDERPFHTLRPGNMHNFQVKDLAGMFNWTMTHRLDSDVPIPYGYTTISKEPVQYKVAIGERHLVAAMISNCNGGVVHNGRLRYIRELNKTANVHLYGNCGNYTCAGYRTMLPWEPCAKLTHYLFFLSFENSNCRDYITEKLFMNALAIGAVPVVMGANRTTYEQLAPPNSFIHVSDFRSPQELGKYLISLKDDLAEYAKFHAWRRHYNVNYRLQYLDEKIWLPLCIALKNDNGTPKVYKDINSWWSVERDCEPSVPEN